MVPPVVASHLLSFPAPVAAPAPLHLAGSARVTARGRPPESHSPGSDRERVTARGPQPARPGAVRRHCCRLHQSPAPRRRPAQPVPARPSPPRPSQKAPPPPVERARSGGCGGRNSPARVHDLALHSQNTPLGEAGLLPKPSACMPRRTGVLGRGTGRRNPPPYPTRKPHLDVPCLLHLEKLLARHASRRGARRLTHRAQRRRAQALLRLKGLLPGTEGFGGDRGAVRPKLCAPRLLCLLLLAELCLGVQCAGPAVLCLRA